MRFPPADATPNLGLMPGAVERDVLLVFGEDPETVYALLEENGVRRRSPVDYLEFRTSRCDLDDVAFARWLTREHGVTGIPLSPFYETPPAGQRLIRFCFAKSDATQRAAAERLRKV